MSAHELGHDGSQLRHHCFARRTATTTMPRGCRRPDRSASRSGATAAAGSSAATGPPLRRCPTAAEERHAQRHGGERALQRDGGLKAQSRRWSCPGWQRRWANSEGWRAGPCRDATGRALAVKRIGNACAAGADCVGGGGRGGAAWGVGDMRRDFATASRSCAGRFLGARLVCGGTSLAGGALAWGGGRQYMLRAIATGGGPARQDKRLVRQRVRDHFGLNRVSSCWRPSSPTGT